MIDVPRDVHAGSAAHDLARRARADARDAARAGRAGVPAGTAVQGVTGEARRAAPAAIGGASGTRAHASRADRARTAVGRAVAAVRRVGREVEAAIHAAGAARRTVAGARDARLAGRAVVPTAATVLDVGREIGAVGATRDQARRARTDPARAGLARGADIATAPAVRLVGRDVDARTSADDARRRAAHRRIGAGGIDARSAVGPGAAAVHRPGIATGRKGLAGRAAAERHAEHTDERCADEAGAKAKWRHEDLRLRPYARPVPRTTLGPDARTTRAAVAHALAQCARAVRAGLAHGSACAGPARPRRRPVSGPRGRDCVSDELPSFVAPEDDQTRDERTELRLGRRRCPAVKDDGRRLREQLVHEQDGAATPRTGGLISRTSTVARWAGPARSRARDRCSRAAARRSCRAPRARATARSRRGSRSRTRTRGGAGKEILGSHRAAPRQHDSCATETGFSSSPRRRTRRGTRRGARG